MFTVANGEAIRHVGKDSRRVGFEHVVENATLVDNSPNIVRDFVIRRPSGSVIIYRPKLDIDDKSMRITSAQATKETTEALEGVLYVEML